MADHDLIDVTRGARLEARVSAAQKALLQQARPQRLFLPMVTVERSLG
ncbi:MAG: hypothetical protein ACLGII_13715 [Gammaproteobacteria bacterium]|jgi:hypothetical protein